MLLGSNNNLENFVVELLTEHGAITADDIYRSITRKKMVSIQSVYHILRKLQKEGIVVKERQKYCLLIPWVLDLISLTNRMERTYSHDAYSNQLIPTRDNKKKEWRFPNLLAMEDFWSQVLLAMARVSKNKIMYDYTPRAWFHVVKPIQEYQYVKALMDMLNSAYTIVGGNDYLDNWIADEYWNFETFNYYLSDEPSDWISKDRSKYIIVMDDLILTTKLHKEITNDIDLFFKNIQSRNDMSPEEIVDTFHQRTPVRITVEKNYEKAQLIKKKFQRIFGIKKT